MKVFEVWGELTLKDTLTQDLAAAQAKVTQFATGIQTQLTRATTAGSGKAGTSSYFARQQDEIAKEMSKQNAEMVKRIALQDKLLAGQIKAENSFKKAMNNQQGKEWSKAFDEATKYNDKLNASLKKSQEEVSNLDKAMARLQRTALAFAAITATLAVVNFLKEMVTSAVELNSTIEDARLGIASLVSAQANITDPFGKQLDGIEKFNAAIKISDDLINQLRIDNLQTTATFDQLLRVFQQSVSVGTGVGFDLDQVRQFSVVLTQTAAAMQVPLDMLNEEVRALLTGAISQRSSIIATRLGLTPEMVHKMRGDAQGFFDFLMERMSAFKYAGIESQKTFTGLWSNVKDAVVGAFAVGTEPFFETLKDAFKGIIDNIVVIDEKTKTMSFNPEFLKDVYALDSALRGLVHTIGFLGKLTGATVGQSLKFIWKPFEEMFLNQPSYVHRGDELLGKLGFGTETTYKTRQELAKLFDDLVKEFERFKTKATFKAPSGEDPWSLNPLKILNDSIEWFANRGKLGVVISQMEKVRDSMANAGMDTKKLDEYLRNLKESPMEAEGAVKKLKGALDEFSVTIDKLSPKEEELKTKFKFGFSEEETKRAISFSQEMLKTMNQYRTELFRNEKGEAFTGFPEEKMKLQMDYLANIAKARDEYTESMRKARQEAEKEAGTNTERFNKIYIEQIKKADDLFKTHKENIKSTYDIEMRIAAVKNYKNILERVKQSQEGLANIKRGYSLENVEGKSSNLSGLVSNISSGKENLLSYAQEVLGQYYELRENFDSRTDYPVLRGLKEQWLAIGKAIQIADSHIEQMNQRIEQMNVFKFQETVRKLDQLVNKKGLLSESEFNKGEGYLGDISGTADSIAAQLAQVEMEQSILSSLPATRDMNEFYARMNRASELSQIASNLRGNLATAEQAESQYTEALAGRRTEESETFMNQLLAVRDILFGIKDYGNINLMIGVDQYDTLKAQIDTILTSMYTIEEQGYNKNIIFNFLDGNGGTAYSGITLINQTISNIPKDVKVNFQFGDALNQLNAITEKFRELKNMGWDYVLSFFGKASPVKPLSETISDVMRKLNSFPSGSTYQVDFLMNKMGMSGSEAVDYLSMNSNLKGLYSALRSAKESAEYYSHPHGLWTGGNTDAMANYYKDAAGQIQQQINSLKLEMYGRAVDSYSNLQSNSNSSSSNSGSGGVDFTVGSIIIELTSTGNAREDVIILADRIDEELGKKILGSESNVLNALKQKGVLN